MSISLKNTMCIAGVLATSYIAANYLTNTPVGGTLKAATQGFAFGALAGLLVNNVTAFPKRCLSFTSMALTSLATMSIFQNVYHPGYSAITGAALAASTALGFINTNRQANQAVGIFN